MMAKLTKVRNSGNIIPIEFNVVYLIVDGSYSPFLRVMLCSLDVEKSIY